MHAAWGGKSPHQRFHQPVFHPCGRDDSTNCNKFPTSSTNWGLGSCTNLFSSGLPHGNHIAGDTETDLYVLKRGHSRISEFDMHTIKTHQIELILPYKGYFFMTNVGICLELNRVYLKTKRTATSGCISHQATLGLLSAH